MARAFAGGTALSLLVGCTPAITPCPLPVPGAPQGSLELIQSLEFGQRYELLEASYFLDDCLLYQTRDPAVLLKPEHSLPARAVASGSHTLRFYFRVRAAFESNLHAYVWDWPGQHPVDLEPGQQVTMKIRLFEQGEGDPRDRLRMITMKMTQGARR